MRRQGMNNERVKQQNRALILRYINENGPVSRKDIAIATGLTPASITQITTQLIIEGILVETGTEEGKQTGAGRKKVLLDIDATSSLVCTVNIESRDTTAGICDLKGMPVKGVSGSGLLRRIDTNRQMAPEDFLRQIAQVCSQLIADLGEENRKKLAAVSVGIAGAVDPERGVSLHAYGIWNRSVDIKSVLEDELDLPVMIENNVEAFAQAEILYGTGRRSDDLMIIKWGPGVGSTIVTGGKVYKGRRGKTAELGHMIVTKNGKPCSCGRRGCLETEVSYRALQAGLEFRPEEFGQRYEQADPKAAAFIDAAIDLFARSIVNAATIVAPGRIVLAGDLFESPVIRGKLISACSSYDRAFGEKRILHTTLAGREGYVGPAAVFAMTRLN